MEDATLGLELNSDAKVNVFKKLDISNIIQTTIIFVGLFLPIMFYIQFPKFDVMLAKQYPVKVLQYISENKIDTVNNVMLNDYNYGGFLIFKGQKVFLDGRADPYMKEFTPNKDILREAFKAMGGQPDEIKGFLSKYKVKYILTSNKSKFAFYANLRNAEWKLLKESDGTCLFVKIERDGIK